MDQTDAKKQETKRKRTNTNIKSNNDKTKKTLDKEEPAAKSKKRGRPRKTLIDDQGNVEKLKTEKKQVKIDKVKTKNDTNKKTKNNEPKDLIKEKKVTKINSNKVDSKDKKKNNKIIGEKLEKKLVEELKIQEELKLQKEELEKNNNEKEIDNFEENINEIGKKIKEKRKVPKKDVAEMRRKYIPNLIMAFTVIVFFELITLGFYKIQTSTFITDLKTFGMLILLLAIILLENAYSKKDKIILAYGIECVVISTITISLIYIYLKMFNKFVIITLIIAAIFTFYYILKYLIIRRVSKNNYFKDKMKEIIEKDEDAK